MNKFTAAAVLAALALAPAAQAAESSQTVRAATAEAGAPVSVTAGKMIYGANGQRIAAAYRVTADGTVQVILNGKLVNIPSSTLSDANGKIATSLTKAELSKLK